MKLKCGYGDFNARLNLSTFFPPDIDECQDDNLARNCRGCVNTYGSYFCSNVTESGSDSDNDLIRVVGSTTPYSVTTSGEDDQECKKGFEKNEDGECVG